MTDPGAIFPMECRVCHRLVRPGRPGWARIMVVCADCSPRRSQFDAHAEEEAVSEICPRCSAMGASRSGLCLDCLDCVAREIADELSRILEGVMPETPPLPSMASQDGTR